MKRTTLFGVLLALLVLAAVPVEAEVRAADLDLNAGPIVVRVFYGEPERIPELFVYDLYEYRNEEQGYVLVRVDPAQYLELMQGTFALEIDVDRTLEARRVPERLAGQFNGIPGFPCYHTVAETYQLAAQWAAEHPSLVSWIDVGDTWEKANGIGGYDLRVLRLTNSAIAGPKPKLIVTSSIHAREYAPAEISIRFAEYLVERYDVDADVTWILDHHEVHLMLQANPDGRRQAENGISWRKNTNTTFCSPTSTFRGVDLNRNFPFEWDCCGGASDSQCNELYRGPSAASEPETQAIRDYLIAEFPDWRGPAMSDAAPDTATGIYMDNHAFGELVIWPWGFGFGSAPNGAQLQTLGRKLASFNDYQPKQAVNLYVTDGTTVDFGYGELGVASYVFEVGTNFFQDCDAFEATILPDNLEALLYAAKAAAAPYLLPAGPDAVDVTSSPGFVQPGESLTVFATLDDTRFNNENGAEPTEAVTVAEAYLGAPPWDPNAPAPLAPVAVDGALDTATETVRLDLDTSALSGRQAVYVRGRDAAGNWGVVGATFVYVADGTEGVVSGQVTRTSDGQPISATVTVDELALQVQTDGAGFYSVQVPVGRWTLRAAALDLLDDVATGVLIGVNGNVALDFSLDPKPTLLIVDDDDNNPSVATTYTFALDALGRDYLVWDTANSDNEPTAQDLASFDEVLWFTGDEFGGAAGPGSAGEDALGQWLDRSGCLLLASQDYHFDRGQTSFMGGYLGLTGVNSSTVPLSAIGQGLFSGFGPYFLSFPYANGGDRLLLDPSADAAMNSGTDPLVSTRDTGVYRTSFWGFGLEGIPGQSNHQGLLAQWLSWCDALPALDGDADGVANGDDCFAGDPDAWSLPGPARDLTVSESPVDGFQWLAPAEIGGTSIAYDLLVTTFADGFGSATCVESALAATTASDATTPAPGSVRYYLVRSRNACGGSLGLDSLGLERSAPPCN